MFYFAILESVTLTFSVCTILLIQKLLFPAEAYWIPIAGCMFVYSSLNIILGALSGIDNFFTRLDLNISTWKDGMWFIVAPLILSVTASVIAGLKLTSTIIIFLLACSLHTYVTYVINLGIQYARRQKLFFKQLFTSIGLVWVISAFIVSSFYYATIKKSLVAYPVNNPIMQSQSLNRGIWYTVPVEKSELFLHGYARFEDSALGDDLGHLFFSVLGSQLGFIAVCDPSHLDISKAIYKSEDKRYQPLFAYSFDVLCPAWANTLPQFYWFIGLMGILFTAILVGVIIFKDPGIFFLTATILLFSWSGWPASRPGQVEMLIFGLPFVAFIPYIAGRGRTSTILVWSFICGVVAGLAGFVRSPIGSTILMTSLLSFIFFLGVRNRRWRTVIVAVIIIIAAQRLIPATLNALFDHRDKKLGITAPIISSGAHAEPGWNLLGGIGGTYTGSFVPTYQNALDMVHWDPIMLLNSYDRNPLAAFGLHYTTSSVPWQIFKQYISTHPFEFTRICLKKTYNAFIILISIPTNWQLMIYLIALLSVVSASIRLYCRIPAQVLCQRRREDCLQFLSIMMVMAIIAVLPAVLTEPTYFQVCYPAAAVLFFATLIGILCFTEFVAAVFAGERYETKI